MALDRVKLGKISRMAARLKNALQDVISDLEPRDAEELIAIASDPECEEQIGAGLIIDGLANQLEQIRDNEQQLRDDVATAIGLFGKEAEGYIENPE